MQRDEPELPGMTRRARDHDAARVEQRADLLRRRPSRRRLSTSASTATGRPSTTMSGFTSTETIVRARRPRARSARGASATSASRSTGGLAPERRRAAPGSRRSSIISSASTRSSGARRKLTSAIASARIPPNPSMTQRPELRRRCARPTISSRVPRTIGRDEQPRPRRPRGAPRASSSPAAVRTASGVADVQAHEPTLGLVRDARRRKASPRRGTPARRPRRPPRRAWPRSAPGSPGRRARRGAASTRSRRAFGWPRRCPSARRR